MTKSNLSQTEYSTSIDEYDKYRGKWIALDSQGTHVLASADDLGDLEDNIVAAGLDPESVVFDRIEEDDTTVGGVGLA